MTVREYLGVLREQWIVITSAVVLTLAAVAAVWFIRPPEYTATLRLYVSAQSTDTAQAAFQGAQLSQQRVTSYVELVSSTRVSGEVIRRLRLDTTPEELAQRVTASSKLDSVIIDVTVTGDSPETVEAVANGIGSIFPRLVDELERPSSPTGIPPVVVRVVQPAEAPASPSSTGLPMSLALGLLTGLALGLGGALARNALDNSVKSPDQLRDVTKVPNLGTIAYDPGVPKHPLTVHENPHSPRAEAFRQLRTNLQFLDVDTQHKVVVVTSSMPGEGKTTTLANLAIALAYAGSRVLVVEADLRRPKLADLLGVERSVGLTSILAGRVRAEQAVQHWSGGVFDVLASGPLPPNPSELLGSQHMATMLADLRERYDLVLLDTPPLLPVTDAAAVAPSTDGAILACRFKKTRRTQVDAAVMALDAVSVPVLGTVFTMVPNTGPRAYAQYNSYYRTDQPIASTGPSRAAQPVPPARSPEVSVHRRPSPARNWP
jgi:capsular exopolysaccharide synthesis family protein